MTKRMIVVENCDSCPYHYSKRSYGAECMERCKLLLDNHIALSECLDIAKYRFTIDPRCPLNILKEQ
jgi:hypothetical protein